MIHGPTADTLANTQMGCDVRTESHKDKKLLSILNEGNLRQYTVIVSGLLYAISDSSAERQVVPTPLLQLLEHADEVYHSGETCRNCNKSASVVDGESYYCVFCSRKLVQQNKSENRLVAATISVTRAKSEVVITTTIEGIPASSSISLSSEGVTDEAVKKAVENTVKNVREKLPLTFQLYIKDYPRIAEGIEIEDVTWKHIDRDSMY